MNPTITLCRSREDLGEALGAIWHYFGLSLAPEDLDRWMTLLGPSRMHAARIDGAIVGGAGAYTHELTVPGGMVSAAAVTVVGVYPTHRRRGIQRAMMRSQLEAIQERGEPVAYLWASEETIYSRYGYGMAALGGSIDLPKTAAAFARPSAARGQVRLLRAEEAVEPISRVYDQVRRVSPGMCARSKDWWTLRRLADPENRRMGGGPQQRAVLELDGEPAGYAIYRIHAAKEGGVAAGHISVVEAMGVTPEATREIWRFLLDIDWIGRVKAHFLPVDHPLQLLLARPRSMGWHVSDTLWVRIIDVPAAFAARAIRPGAPVVVEVTDEFLESNTGRYEIGAGRLGRTTADPDLACDINALGSVYLSGFTMAQLVRSGRAMERREGAAQRLDDLLRWDRAPWCPEVF